MTLSTECPFQRNVLIDETSIDDLSLLTKWLSTQWLWTKWLSTKWPSTKWLFTKWPSRKWLSTKCPSTKRQSTNYPPSLVNSRQYDPFGLTLTTFFTFDHQTFAVSLRSDGMSLGVVVGLCSELFVRLSYYIHLGYGKKLSSHLGFEPRFVSRLLYPLTRALTLFCHRAFLY